MSVSEEMYEAAKAKTLDDFLDAWDGNQEVVIVSMGGLGNGYEAHIWNMARDMIDAIKDEEIDWLSLEGPSEEARERWRLIRKKMEANVSEELMQNASGAQFGAAINIASVLVRNGYSKALEMAGKDRLMTIRRADKYENA
jgi:hypothetical protein